MQHGLPGLLAALISHRGKEMPHLQPDRSVVRFLVEVEHNLQRKNRGSADMGSQQPQRKPQRATAPFAAKMAAMRHAQIKWRGRAKQ